MDRRDLTNTANSKHIGKVKNTVLSTIEITNMGDSKNKANISNQNKVNLLILTNYYISKVNTRGEKGMKWQAIRQVFCKMLGMD